MRCTSGCRPVEPPVNTARPPPSAATPACAEPCRVRPARCAAPRARSRRPLRFMRSGALSPGSSSPRSIVRVAVQRDLDLGLLGRGRQRVAESLLQRAQQARVMARIVVPAFHATQFAHTRRRVHGVDQVPGGEVEVHAAGHLARVLAGPCRPARTVAQQRQDAGQFDVAVEVGAGQVHAVVGQDVVTALGTAAPRRAHAHQREVGCAAADVGHQHQLFAVDVAFVVQRGGDRFELEPHLVEARPAAPRSCSAACACASRAGSSSTKNTGRPSTTRAQRHGPPRPRRQLQAAQVAGHHVAVAHRAAGADVGALVEQTRAEDALHRTHQTARRCLRHTRPSPHGRTAARPALRAPACRRGRTPRWAWSRGRVRVRPAAHRHRHARQRHRRVGGAEVDGHEAAAGVGGNLAHAAGPLHRWRRRLQQTSRYTTVCANSPLE